MKSSLKTKCSKRPLTTSSVMIHFVLFVGIPEAYDTYLSETWLHSLCATTTRGFKISDYRNIFFLFIF